MKKINNIQKNGFKTPENYFQNFNEEIQIRIIEEKLKDRFGKKNPFIVPNNYFKNFSVEKEEAKSSGKIIQMLKPYLSIAAGIILLLGFWQIVLMNIDSNENKISDIRSNNKTKTEILAGNTLNFEDIDIFELKESADEYINEIDESSIIDYTSEKTINLEIDASEDEITDYLIEYLDENEFDEVLASL